MRELTEEESDVLDALCNAWDKFLELPIIHPDHQTEFRHNLHILQRMIMSRPVSEFLRIKES